MRPSAIPNPKPKQSKTAWLKANPFMAGLAFGLLLAALLALYITQSPLPFVDRVGTRAVIDKSKVPKGMVEADDAVDPNKGLLSKDAGQTETSVEAGIETKGTSPTGMAYLLQVGAFRSAEDAEQMRARMAILGFEAKVTQADRDGAAIYRVRLGPYSSIEELNKSKARVSENGIDSTVVRVNP
jgi:cell division protein FtsN